MGFNLGFKGLMMIAKSNGEIGQDLFNPQPTGSKV